MPAAGLTNGPSIPSIQRLRRTGQCWCAMKELGCADDDIANAPLICAAWTCAGLGLGVWVCAFFSWSGHQRFLHRIHFASSAGDNGNITCLSVISGQCADGIRNWGRGRGMHNCATWCPRATIGERVEPLDWVAPRHNVAVITHRLISDVCTRQKQRHGMCSRA